jgi:hypothetical protein
MRTPTDSAEEPVPLQGHAHTSFSLHLLLRDPHLFPQEDTRGRAEITRSSPEGCVFGADDVGAEADAARFCSEIVSSLLDAVGMEAQAAPSPTRDHWFTSAPSW